MRVASRRAASTDAIAGAEDSPCATSSSPAAAAGRCSRSSRGGAGDRRAPAGHPEVRRAATVAAYVSIGTEPGTGPAARRAAATAGRRVILPVVLPDLDLDWAVYDGPDGLARARRGLLEPDRPAARPRRGRHRRRGARPRGSPSTARGMRLGQGGGCYDRALGRVPVGTFTCTLLYDDELLDGCRPTPTTGR